MRNNRCHDVCSGIRSLCCCTCSIGRRRLLGTALLVAGLVRMPTASGQRPARTFRVGVLTPGPAQWREEAFRRRLRELGYVEGDNLMLDLRSADAHLERLPALSRDLVARRPDVIVAVNTPGTRAAVRETRTIPIVMAMVGDPVGLGFVTNLARPDGNVTGLSNMVGEIAAKRLSLLREAIPSAKRIALLYHPDEPIVEPQLRDLDSAARPLGVAFLRLAVRTQHDLERAFDAAAEWRADGVLRLAGQASTHGRQSAELALKRRIPSMLFTTRDVEAGALMSYYLDDDAAYQRVADYVDRILRGALPGELPIEQPTRFEFAVNVRTARSLGLELPPSLLLRADRVLE